MVARAEEDYVLTCRRALEALRNGVPNREAVRIMGCNQPRAEARFDEMLTGAIDTDNPPANSLGMLVSGDFGSGKSHLWLTLSIRLFRRTSFAARWSSAKRRRCTIWARCSRQRWRTAGCRNAAGDSLRSWHTLWTRTPSSTQTSSVGQTTLLRAAS